jgi:hypothetical protein
MLPSTAGGRFAIPGLRFVAGHVLLSPSVPTMEHHDDPENQMTCVLSRILASLATLLIAAHANAYEAGWMQIQVAGTTPDAPTTTVAPYYPTMAAPRAIAMGPFAINAAIGGNRRHLHRVPNAWHFAFMDTPSMPIPPDGDIGQA